MGEENALAAGALHHTRYKLWPIGVRREFERTAWGDTGEHDHDSCS